MNTWNGGLEGLLFKTNHLWSRCTSSRAHLRHSGRLVYPLFLGTDVNVLHEPELNLLRVDYPIDYPPHVTVEIWRATLMGLAMSNLRVLKEQRYTKSCRHDYWSLDQENLRAVHQCWYCYFLTRWLGKHILWIILWVDTPNRTWYWLHRSSDTVFSGGARELGMSESIHSWPRSFIWGFWSDWRLQFTSHCGAWQMFTPWDFGVWPR